MPRKIPFYIVDSFTDIPFQGNPAGVFFDDDASLTDEEMQKLAGEVSLESAFVRQGTDGADFQLRYFTGVCEVPFCGHDTVATIVVLAQIGRITVPATVFFSTNVGIIPAAIERQAEEQFSVRLIQKAASLRPPLNRDNLPRIASALGCEETDIGIEGLPVQWASTGTPWLYVPVSSRAIVDRTPNDFTAITELSREWETFGLYVFTVERGPDGKLLIWSRCYAPIAGLNEDPVTGSATGGLGGYLASHDLLPTYISPRWPEMGSIGGFTTQQGFAGGRGGTTHVGVVHNPDDTIREIWVGGTATLIAEGAVTLPG